MNIRAIRTKHFVPNEASIDQLINAIGNVPEDSIVVISSKVVSICEGSIISVASVPDKDALITSIASAILEPEKRSKNQMLLTITKGILVESAGIDESNGDGYYVLPPNHPYKSAKSIWAALKDKYKLTRLGIIISDSHSLPSKRGAIGFAYACFGFKPVRYYTAQNDIFGHGLGSTAIDLADSIAAAAGIVMGEGGESQPIVIVTGVVDVEYLPADTSESSMANFAAVHHSLDVYGPLLDSSLWQRS